MYQRLLKVMLVGIGEDAAAAMEKVEAPKRFAFELSRAQGVDVELARASDVAIVDAGLLGQGELEGLSAAVREGVGFKELAIVATPDQIAALSEGALSLVDAIWPAPLTPELAAFEFGRMAARARAQAELFITGNYLQTIIDSMPAMVWFKAADGEHVKVNEYFCHIVDKTREDVTGQFHNYIWSVPEEDWEKAELTCKESDDAAIRAGKTLRCDENVSTHGEIRLFDTYKTPIFDEDGTVLGTSGFATDVTLERELERRAWLSARTDYLTNLYNRRYFYEYLEEHAAEGPVTFALIDLDNFKSINDEDGHGEGDNALLVVTAALRKCFPDCQIVRWGGDEFIVVVPQSAADLVADENVRAFQDTVRAWTAEKCAKELTASIGIARQGQGESVDHAVKRADDALYQAKADGKACHRRA